MPLAKVSSILREFLREKTASASRICVSTRGNELLM